MQFGAGLFMEIRGHRPEGVRLKLNIDWFNLQFQLR